MKLIDLSHAAVQGVPALVVRSGVEIERISLESLVTLAAVVDVSMRRSAADISRDDVSHFREAGVGGCILCSGWLDGVLAGFREAPPKLEMQAAAYLLERGVRTVAADFPLTGEAADLLLLNNCVLVECISNAGELSGRIVRLIALPVKRAGTRSAEARVIAIEE